MSSMIVDVVLSSYSDIDIGSHQGMWDVDIVDSDVEMDCYYCYHHPAAAAAVVADAVVDHHQTHLSHIQMN